MMLVGTILFGTQSISAQTKTLKFGDDGKFKIVQFTDVHWRYGDAKSEEA
ncbi:MAG: metallophosphatase, partial [Alistipes sp.]|nr:metallophosphatase [Alistipes sp.]